MSLPLSSTEYLSSTIVIEIDLSFFHKGEAVLRHLQHITLPEMQNGPAVSEIWLLLSPIRHYFPDCGRLNEPALGSAQQDSHLPRISRAAPIACICGWTGCLFRADGIIARQIAASAFGWVSIALHLKGRSLTSDDCPMQVVFAHPPHRCSPSSGGRQPTLCSCL